MIFLCSSRWPGLTEYVGPISTGLARGSCCDPEFTVEGGGVEPGDVEPPPPLLHPLTTSRNPSSRAIRIRKRRTLMLHAGTACASLMATSVVNRERLPHSERAS